MAALPEEDREWVVRTLIGEVRGEPYVGQLAVAHAIRNRQIVGKEFRSLATPRDVVLPERMGGKSNDQFSVWNPWSESRNPIEHNNQAKALTISKDSTLYKLFETMVDDVWEGRSRDPVEELLGEGAPYYLNPDVTWIINPDVMRGDGWWAKLERENDPVSVSPASDHLFNINKIPGDEAARVSSYSFFDVETLRSSPGAVRAAQTVLRGRGINIEIDGVISPETISAMNRLRDDVHQSQRLAFRNEDQTGATVMRGFGSLIRLKDPSLPVPPRPKPEPPFVPIDFDDIVNGTASTAQVERAQTALKELGLYGFDIDGLVGPGTRDAVEKYFEGVANGTIRDVNLPPSDVNAEDGTSTNLQAPSYLPEGHPSLRKEDGPPPYGEERRGDLEPLPDVEQVELASLDASGPTGPGSNDIGGPGTGQGNRLDDPAPRSDRDPANPPSIANVVFKFPEPPEPSDPQDLQPDRMQSDQEPDHRPARSDGPPRGKALRIRHRYYTAESQAIHDARFEDRNKGEMTDEDWERAEPILKFMRWHRRRGRPQEDPEAYQTRVRQTLIDAFTRYGDPSFAEQQAAAEAKAKAKIATEDERWRQRRERLRRSKVEEAFLPAALFEGRPVPPNVVLVGPGAPGPGAPGSAVRAGDPPLAEPDDTGDPPPRRRR